MPDSMFSSNWMARLCGAIALTALAACGGGGGGGGGGDGGGGDPGGGSWVPGQFLPSDSFKAMCESPRTGTSDLQGTVLDENNFLRSYSNETYLWYDEIVDQDPSLPQFDSPLDYFDVLMTNETTASGAPKDNFHFTMSTEEWEQLSQSGAAAGYGAQWVLISNTPPREVVVAYTEPGSPATDPGANLARGAQVLTVDGVNVANGTDVDTLNAGLFPATAGETHTFTVRDLGAANTRQVTMTSEVVISTPVQNVTTAASPTGSLVGYLLFNDHIAPAESGLIDAVEQLQAAGIDELVVDLRYNGGGFLAIASQFAYMIAGAAQTGGRTFEEIRFNDKHPTTDPVTGEPLEPMPFIDETLNFSEPAGNPLPSLGLQRVFVLTGPGTCSASESIMNGLRGIDVEVIQIGSTTCGKPYGFYPTDNCGTTYFTIQFQGVNEEGFGDYSDGFSPANNVVGTAVPGCSVADDFEHELGSPAEARFAAALGYIGNGSCPTPTGVTAPGLVKPGAPLSATDGITPKSPWHQNRILRRQP
jgi:carboxyl-terminal processing protease